ncbi:hypothetical protein MPSEU_000266900 [Mayamaea pseudoterrestris]|nr:hypothetical protein MPSEU_000266900 [Mayamaea pseudoterrestris]
MLAVCVTAAAAHSSVTSARLLARSHRHRIHSRIRILDVTFKPCTRLRSLHLVTRRCATQLASAPQTQHLSLLDRVRARFTSKFWRRLATVLKYTRIPFLVASVYGLGYQQGILECTRNPEALQKNLLQSMLVSLGVTEKDITVVQDGKIAYGSNKKHHQVAAVGHAIIQAARDYAKEQLQTAMDDCKTKLPPDISQQDLMIALQRDELVQEWQTARLRLEGEYGDKQWQYIFIHTPNPNAFVTEILPQRFFITSSMLQIAETSDELAVVLGHEVSHLLLGHVSSTNSVEMILRTVEVLLLTLDPTAGAFSVAVMAMLASFRHAMSTAYSRDNEYEADKVGLEIAARACFDTTRGVEVIRKMHESRVAAQPNVSSSWRVSQVYDTHPPTLDRYDRLVEGAKMENYNKYRKCANKRRPTRRLSSRPQVERNAGASSYSWLYFWKPAT